MIEIKRWDIFNEGFDTCEMKEGKTGKYVLFEDSQNEMRRVLEFGIHYGWNTPTIEPETDDEAWVEFIESGSKEGE